MKQIGSFLLFFGVGSMVLNLIDYEFILLMWVDNWGSGIGWGIRSAAVVIGALMYFMGNEEETA